MLRASSKRVWLAFAPSTTAIRRRPFFCAVAQMQYFASLVEPVLYPSQPL